VSQVVATPYGVLVEHKLAEQGRALLAKMPVGRPLTGYSLCGAAGNLYAGSNATEHGTEVAPRSVTAPVMTSDETDHQPVLHGCGAAFRVLKSHLEPVQL
jgi:hypothetical protein